MASKKFMCLLNSSKQLSKTNISATLSVRTYSDIVDQETHTGQKFDKDDYRLVRFLGKEQKEVNPNWAVKLIAELPPTPSKERIIACDGGGGPLGHPKVYINLDKAETNTCGYCGKTFYKEQCEH